MPAGGGLTTKIMYPTPHEVTRTFAMYYVKRIIDICDESIKKNTNQRTCKVVRIKDLMR